MTRRGGPAPASRPARAPAPLSDDHEARSEFRCAARLPSPAGGDRQRGRRSLLRVATGRLLAPKRFGPTRSGGRVAEGGGWAGPPAICPDCRFTCECDSFDEGYHGPIRLSVRTRRTGTTVCSTHTQPSVTLGLGRDRRLAHRRQLSGLLLEPDALPGA